MLDLMTTSVPLEFTSLGKRLVQEPVLCPSRMSPLHCPGCCPASVSLVCEAQAEAG